VSLKAQAQSVLATRALSYQRVFLKKGVDTDKVLSDLAKFCRANTSTYQADPRLSDVLIGRREVWLRIQHHLQLSDDQLWHLYGNNQLPEE